MFHLTIHAKLLYHKNFNTHIHDRKIPVISLCFKIFPLISTHTQDPVIILFNSSAESLLYTHTKKNPTKKKTLLDSSHYCVL